MRQEIINEFYELNEMEMREVDGGWGGILGSVESFLTNRLIWTNAKLTWENGGGMIITSGPIVA